MTSRRLKLLPRQRYRDVRESDPLRFYFVPLLGGLYRRRVEMCLSECRGGRRVLEIGFGCGVTFPSLDEIYDEIHGIDLEARVDEVAAAFAQLGIEVDLRRADVLDLPYGDAFFDTVLAISMLEHLRPERLADACLEIRRVLRPGGQLIYGVPVERPLMTLAFRGLGYDIRKHHFSTEKQIGAAVRQRFEEVRSAAMTLPVAGRIYEVGHFRRSGP